MRDEAAFGRGAVKMPTVVSAAPTMVTNMTGILDHQARVELFEGVADGRAGDFPVKKGRSFVSHKIDS